MPSPKAFATKRPNGTTDPSNSRIPRVEKEVHEMRAGSQLPITARKLLKMNFHEVLIHLHPYFTIVSPTKLRASFIFICPLSNDVSYDVLHDVKTSKIQMHRRPRSEAKRS